MTTRFGYQGVQNRETKSSGRRWQLEEGSFVQAKNTSEISADAEEVKHLNVNVVNHPSYTKSMAANDADEDTNKNEVRQQSSAIFDTQDNLPATPPLKKRLRSGRRPDYNRLGRGELVLIER
ncbi:hypothetical protein Pmar_PMAR010475 [Perkinsus marinus ATCC 50983]|uniref:Uncharacterized protein n=1 Tax=Perkinsus marinus (strain ATCC 50983 / TXsc) TaxID=423536 RepID=C5LEE1_PERM5|nr:hypothetical protein Pmar_PMAR010475 [Perkinsus marinus ATCC 50983]EER04923.1 hypothetical protein Pmar_PMAR010475 [Perkinsus marinus ATCC 50983]|eukprot:XP_002773107.1 hypothetical protein Pmar_PMAR010475 [Perkinsus marinus ATCC 50983]